MPRGGARPRRESVPSPPPHRSGRRPTGTGPAEGSTPRRGRAPGRPPHRRTGCDCRRAPRCRTNAATGLRVRGHRRPARPGTPRRHRRSGRRWIRAPSRSVVAAMSVIGPMLPASQKVPPGEPRGSVCATADRRRTRSVPKEQASDLGDRSHRCRYRNLQPKSCDPVSLAPSGRPQYLWRPRRDAIPLIPECVANAERLSTGRPRTAISERRGARESPAGPRRRSTAARSGP